MMKNLVAERKKNKELEKDHEEKFKELGKEVGETG